MRKMILVYAWFEEVKGRMWFKDFDDYANDNPTFEIERPEGWYLIARLGLGMLDDKLKLLQKRYSRLKLKEIEASTLKESIVPTDLKEPTRGIFDMLYGNDGGKATYTWK